MDELDEEMPEMQRQTDRQVLLFQQEQLQDLGKTFQATIFTVNLHKTWKTE